MSITAAHVIVGSIAGEPLDMRIVVPGTENARKRICIYAQVIAQAYSNSIGPHRCKWCETEIEGPAIFVHGGEEVRTYCSAACLVASF